MKRLVWFCQLLAFFIALFLHPPLCRSASQEALLSNVRQLIFEGRRSGEGYFSGDGKRMIFQSEREPGNPFYQIYLMDLETGDTRRVSPGIGKTTCGWIHPQGDKVLFASTHEDPEALAKQREELDKRASGQGSRYSWSFDEHYDIFAASSDGRSLINLTKAPGYDAEGSWSPDGSLIAFASNRHAYQGSLSEEERQKLAEDPSYFMELYVMNADGSALRRLTETPGYDGGPFFSPDGKRLVWRRFAPDGATAEVWTMKLDGSDQRQITRLGVMSWAPYYHPSGEYLIFTNNLHGFANFELYLVDSNGAKEPVRVTDSEGFDGLPVFTADGQQLAWASTRTAERRAQIFIADWNHAAALRLLGIKSPPVGDKPTDPRQEAPMPEMHRTSAAINGEDLRLHLEYLASPQLEGRLAGSPGERLVAEYLASAFTALGLAPAGDKGSYLQPFEFTAGISLGKDNRLQLIGDDQNEEFALDKDWRPLAFSAAGSFDAAKIAFVGYGIQAPATENYAAYDAYGDAQVAGKWVMVLRYLPENVAPVFRQHLVNYADLHYKAMLARDKGALGLLVVSGPNSRVRNQLVPLNFDAALAGSSLGAISISDRLAERLLEPSGKKLKELQDAWDGRIPASPLEFEGDNIVARIQLKYQQASARNVLAMLPASKGPPLPAVVIGAHFDHIGRGEGLNSLARAGEQGQIHPGADDNASGVAALLEIAQYLAFLRNRGELDTARDILFAAWSGEELGRLGSDYFARTLAPGVPGGEDLGSLVAAYLNLDMIGRLDRHLYLQGVGSSPVWSGEIERRNAPLGLPVVPQNDSYLPTDATSFYLRGVPVLNAFTGAHPDYNTPRDTAERINYPGAARIAKLMALLTRSLALAETSPEYIAMEKPAGSPSRRNLRAYLGTIPEYGTSEIVGVKLAAVAKGGPAETAGLRGEDIILELAGRKIENVYDYTYALNGLKIGQTVQIKVRRRGQELEFSITPASRE